MKRREPRSEVNVPPPQKHVPRVSRWPKKKKEKLFGRVCNPVANLTNCLANFFWIISIILENRESLIVSQFGPENELIESLRATQALS